MKRNYTLFFIMIMILFLQSCQTEVEVNLPDYEPKLAVEGIIENGKVPMVVLTKSIPYFSSISLEYLMQEVIIQNAIVTVTSSTGESEQLQFQYYPESPLYVAYVGHNLKGELNKDYTLTIEWDNKSYYATTSILNTFEIDSLWFAKPSEILDDTMKTIRLSFTDDITQTNYYQFWVKVHGARLTDRLWISQLPIAFDDITFNGQSINIELMRANPSTLLMAEMTEEEQQEFYRMTFRPGDTVYIKCCSIDYDSYRFWMTGGTEMSLGQNPFMSPTPVISNIKGDAALGLWCGYAAQEIKLIYPTE